MLYRVKQFIWDITSNVKPIDGKLVNNYLNQKEIEVFNKLRHSEKHHSIRVCNDALDFAEKNNIKINKYKLGKAALLHDVGKVTGSVNVIDKSILVLLDKFSKGAIRKFSNIKKIDLYYNHPVRGANILKNRLKYDNEFLDVVKNHHLEIPKNNENKYLEIIKICDDRN